MTIIHLKNNKIDKVLWDERITSAKNGVVYAMSWYLDVVSPSWEALVSENYDYIMPLPVKSKFGLRYLTQPYFTQQLGVFSSDDILLESYEDFLEAISLKYVNIQMNTGNVFNQTSENLRPNYTLRLNDEYDNLKKAYKSNCIRNLKKSIKLSQKIETNITIDRYINFIVANAGNRPIVNLIDVLKALLLQAQNAGALNILTSIDEKTGELLAGVVFLMWMDRAYYLVPASSELGKTYHSMSFLIDQFIMSNSSRDLVLDFEGSAISGISRFYQGFGATKEVYPVYFKNKLPKLPKKKK